MFQSHFYQFTYNQFSLIYFTTLLRAKLTEAEMFVPTIAFQVPTIPVHILYPYYWASRYHRLATCTHYSQMSPICTNSNFAKPKTLCTGHVPVPLSPPQKCHLLSIQIPPLPCVFCILWIFVCKYIFSRIQTANPPCLCILSSIRPNIWSLRAWIFQFPFGRSYVVRNSVPIRDSNLPNQPINQTYTNLFVFSVVSRHRVFSWSVLVHNA